MPFVLAIVAVLVGALAWTFTEYTFHRWMMHAGIGPKMVEDGHASHHRDPQKRPLASPLAVTAVSVAGVTLLPLVGAAIAVAVGLPWFVGALFGPGFIAGYLSYERIHHHAHFDPPRTQYGRWVRRRHLHHHFLDGTTNFATTNPGWDVLFGTYRRSEVDLDPRTGRPVGQTGAPGS